MSDEEFLLRAVMPADQVDTMQMRSPHQLHYNPAIAPVLKLLKGMKEKPQPAYFEVKQPGFRLALKSRHKNFSG